MMEEGRRLGTKEGVPRSSKPCVRQLPETHLIVVSCHIRW